MAKQIRVLVLGYGEMGHAIEYLIKSGNHYRQLNKSSETQLDVVLQIWDKYPEKGSSSVNHNVVNLEEAMPQADLVFFCLPVNPHREIVEQISPLLKKGSICISIAKGLDEGGQTAAEIFSDVFASNGNPEYALMYGPMISEEICAGRYAFAQLACSDNESYNKINELFGGAQFYLEQAYDISGISWSVILKNVYAMIFGMADELKLGDNMRGYIAYAALMELDQIVRKNGGESGSPYHLAGLGDLITTGTSEDSHHHELGRMLARGETQNISGEGVHTLEMVKKYQIVEIADYPLFQLIERIVHDPSDVKSCIDEYLNHVFNKEKA